MGFMERASVNAIPPAAHAEKVDIRSESNEKIELVDALTSAIEHALEVENQRAPAGRRCENSRDWFASRRQPD